MNKGKWSYGGNFKRPAAKEFLFVIENKKLNININIKQKIVSHRMTLKS